MGRNACRGFSLLEVLVAFSILVIVLGGLFQVFGGGLRAATLGDRYTRATLIAESKLAALIVDGDAIEGVYTDEQDEFYQSQVTVSAYEDPGAPPAGSLSLQPLTVKVEVSWLDDGMPRSVSLSTMVLSTRQ